MNPIFSSPISLEATGLEFLPWLALTAIVLIAAVIRGYAGFGFSAIVVASSSLFMPTREVVPLVILLEIVASVQMAAQIWRQVNWPLVFSILAASILFIPLGQRVLLWMPIEPMRAVAAILLLTAIGLHHSGWSFPVRQSPWKWFLIGCVSGFMNGLLAMGGLWIMIFLLGAGVKIATVRASLVALFFTTDCYAALSGLGQGLVDTTIGIRFIWALPVLFLGVWVGSRQFNPHDAKTYRKVVLGVLAFLAVVLLFKALMAIII